MSGGFKRCSRFGVIGVFVVAHKGGEHADWLCDLWLAERKEPL